MKQIVAAEKALGWRPDDPICKSVTCTVDRVLLFDLLIVTVSVIFVQIAV